MYFFMKMECLIWLKSYRIKPTLPICVYKDGAKVYLCVCVHGGADRQAPGGGDHYLPSQWMVIIHTAEKFKLMSRIFLVIFLLLRSQTSSLLIGNYKKLSQLLFAIVFVNQKTMLLKELHSPRFSVTTLFLSYSTAIYYIMKNHSNFYGILRFYMTI